MQGTILLQLHSFVIFIYKLALIDEYTYIRRCVHTHTNIKGSYTSTHCATDTKHSNKVMMYIGRYNSQLCCSPINSYVSYQLQSGTERLFKSTNKLIVDTSMIMSYFITKTYLASYCRSVISQGIRVILSMLSTQLYNEL